MIALLVACTAPTGDTAVDPAPASDEPVFDVAPLTPEYDASAIDGVVAAALDDGLFLGIDVHNWFIGLAESLMTGEPGCPSWEETDIVDTVTSNWGGECASARYAVSGDWRVELHDTRDEESIVLAGIELYSFAGQTTGGEVAAGGQAIVYWQATRDRAEFELTYFGSARDASTDGILAAGVSVGIELSGTYTTRDGFVGTAAGPFEGAGTAVSFDDLVFTAGCAAPSGTLSVRDPSTGWWTLALPDDCSGCGPLVFDGEERGTSCAGLAVAEAIDARLRGYLESPPG